MYAAQVVGASVNNTYTIEESLGSGTYASVYCGRNVSSGKEFAVKIYDNVHGAVPTGTSRSSSSSAMANAEQNSAFLMTREDIQREIDVWKIVGVHKHCLSIIRSFFEYGSAYLIMEKCAGSLFDKMDVADRIVADNPKRLFREMLLGIQHLHKVCVIHLDIKPDNFLLGGANNETVKLCDFGLSVHVPKDSAAKLTAITGTAPYMSPEMLKGKGYDFKTDMWSFGVTAFRLIYGEFPYMPADPTDADCMKIDRAIANDQPQIFFADLGRRESLKNLIERTLQRNPAIRCNATQALLLPFFGPFFNSEKEKSSTISRSTTHLSGFSGSTGVTSDPSSPVGHRQQQGNLAWNDTSATKDPGGEDPLWNSALWSCPEDSLLTGETPPHSPKPLCSSVRRVF